MAQTLISSLEERLAGNLPVSTRRNLRIDIASALLYGAFFGATTPFILVTLRKMGASEELIALYLALRYVGSILTFFSIMQMRKHGTFRVVLICWLMGRSLFLIFAVVSNTTVFLAACSLFWMLEGFAVPGYTQIMKGIYPEHMRGRAMSITQTAQVVVVLLVTPLAGWLLDQIGVQLLFPLASFLGIASVLVFMRIDYRESNQISHPQRILSELKSIVRQDRRFSLYLVSLLLYGIGGVLPVPLYPLVLVDRLNLSYSELGILSAIESTVWLFSHLIWGQLVDSRGGMAVMQTIYIISVIIPLAYATASNNWLIVPAYVATGVVVGGFKIGTVNAGIQLATPAQVTEYAALQSTVVGLRGILAPIITTALLYVGISHAGIFIISASLMTLAWIFLRRVSGAASM